ncbi:hypothetical protein FRC00_004066 [Tulasnella sp. 408]|nr:hypothetical protein FRC00_004066 [Tulasnella sp. 408]
MPYNSGCRLAGVFVTRAFLSGLFNPCKVKRVIVLTRQPSSAAAKELQAQGAEIYDSDITPKTLEGVDAVVNALGMAASKEVNDNLARAVSEAGVKVYIPNEFGLDMRPLGHYGKPWAIMSTYARELNGGAMKVISVYPGTFLDLIFPMAPLIGLDIQNSRARIGLSVANMVVLATDDPTSVPDFVHLSGGAISWVGLAKIIEKERGENITINIGDVDILKEKIEKEDDKLSAGRYTYAIGASDYSENNVNELVNPSESLWKWDTIEETRSSHQGIAYRC